MLSHDRTLHLFSTVPDAADATLSAASGGAALPPAKPVLSLDCSGGEHGATARAWTPDGRQWMERHHITEIAFYSTNREVFYGANNWSKGGAELRLPTPTPRGGRPATVGLGGRLDRLGLRPVSPRLARMEDGWVD